MQWFVLNGISIFWLILLSFNVNFSLVHLVGKKIWLPVIVFNFSPGINIMHVLSLVNFYIMQFFTHQRKMIILRRLIKDVLLSTSCASTQVHITFFAVFSCRILISTPVLVWRKSYMSIGWMSPRHLEARILIHQNRRCFSPFVSWFEIIKLLKYYMYCCALYYYSKIH